VAFRLESDLMSKKTKTTATKKQRMERTQQFRRDAIISTAEAFFLNKSYDTTFMDQIAVEAGYTKATIYNYFDTKDDLFVAVVSRAYEKMLEVFEAARMHLDSQSALRVMGDAYVTFVYEYPKYAGLVDSGRVGLSIGRILQKEETNQTLTVSEQEFRRNQMRIQELLTDAISETMKTSAVPIEIDPFSVIVVLSTLGLSIRELALRGKRNNWSEKRSREYLDVLLNIIDRGLKHYAE
jgi:AcrR family transcriptional regulator